MTDGCQAGTQGRDVAVRLRFENENRQAEDA